MNKACLTCSLRHGLINPMNRLILSTEARNPMAKFYEPVEQDLSCDIDVLNLRTLTSSTLHKEVTFDYHEISEGI